MSEAMTPQEQMNINSSVFATVISLNGDLVILRTENNQEIIWPLSKLPQPVHIGMELNLFASTSPILTTEKLDNEKAKKILEMILNS